MKLGIRLAIGILWIGIVVLFIFNVNTYKMLQEDNKGLNASLELAIHNLQEYKELYETERDIKEHKADDLKECSVEKERLEGVTKRLVESKITLPTLDEVKDFLRKDKTDTIQWSTDFDCTEFSNIWIANFRDKGYYACTTELELNGNRGHILVAVKLEDGSIIFIEPQTNGIIFDLEENSNYCDYLNWGCSWYIRSISHCF